MSLITVKYADNNIEAQLIKQRLELEGVTCFLKDEHMMSLDPLFNVAMNGIKIQVHEGQAEEAVLILKKLEEMG